MTGGPEDTKTDSIRQDRYITQAAYHGVQILALQFGYGDGLVARMSK
jgi:hypothetical protein